MSKWIPEDNTDEVLENLKKEQEDYKGWKNYATKVVYDMILGHNGMKRGVAALIADAFIKSLDRRVVLDDAVARIRITIEKDSLFMWDTIHPNFQLSLMVWAFGQVDWYSIVEMLMYHPSLLGLHEEKWAE